ncbi:MAG: hypothetical protein ABJC12_10090 [Saprospiraceae bacterium]
MCELGVITIPTRPAAGHVRWLLAEIPMADIRLFTKPGFDIVGISFERRTEEEKALNAIRTYRDKLKIPYPIVYGGSNDKIQASAVLPMLNNVIAFPTLIFLDDQNKVLAIHTGFEGPATSGYQKFKDEFDVLVKKMKQIE